MTWEALGKQTDGVEMVLLMLSTGRRPLCIIKWSLVFTRTWSHCIVPVPLFLSCLRLGDRSNY